MCHPKLCQGSTQALTGGSCGGGASGTVTYIIIFLCADWTSGVNNVNQGYSLRATSVSAGASASPACSYAYSDFPAESTYFKQGIEAFVWMDDICN